MGKNKTIIVAPLNWGLGHATRCIPIIHHLIGCGHKVILASDGEPLELLKREFPQLPYETLPSYGIRYKYKSIFINMLTQWPTIAKAIRAEKKAAKDLVDKWSADVLISDNRMGFRSQLTKNVYITHQTSIHTSTRMLSWLADTAHAFFYDKFDEMWIPDYADNRVAGNLSKTDNEKAWYIGPLSRFTKDEGVAHKPIDIIAVLSGPEPQRSNLEAIFVAWIAERYAEKKVTLVRGTNALRLSYYPHNMEVLDLVGGEILQGLLKSSTQIVCRSGYSSIMDLFALGRSALLIPTPGQTEQEYLARFHNGKHGFKYTEQATLNQFYFDK